MCKRDNPANRHSSGGYTTVPTLRLTPTITRRVFALFGIGAIRLLGADAWNKKPSEWSDRDIQKILTKSPWAREATATLNLQAGAMDAPPAGGGRGGGRGGPPGGGMGGPPGGGGMGGADGPAMEGGESQMHAIVRWDSALPIRLALKKQGESKPHQYLIAVTGLRMMSGRQPNGGSRPDSAQAQNRMREGARLERKGKDPILASSAELLETGDARVMQFMFDPGSDPIQPEDREVQFVATMGPMQIKAKFTLKEMVYEGKLEL